MAELAASPSQLDPQRSTEGPSSRLSALLPALPYPGIRPFQKEEWPIFCGRQRIVDDLLEALGKARFLPVLGTSGCGKSSLIKAGVIATLERESGRLGASWRTVEMRPGNTPMWNLAEALWTATHPGRASPKGPPPEEVAAVRALLGRGPGGIARVIDSHAFPSDHNLLLHIDQFEELFRFGRLSNQPEVEAFVDQLVDVFDGRPKGIYVVSTMRTDFLGDCGYYPRLTDAFNQTGYLLRSMTEAELRQAIQSPATLYRGSVEPQLVDCLIRDGEREQDLLPVTEHALMWMWIRTGKKVGATLRLDDYLSEDVGGIEGALSRHADQIYDRLGAVASPPGSPPRDLRPVAKRLFQALSDTDRDGRVIRRPVPFGELCAVIDVEPDDLAHVVNAFREPGCSFLMPPAEKPLDEKTVVDVSHEALIRQWSKMEGRAGDTDWVEEEAQDGHKWELLANEALAYGKNNLRLLSTDQSADFRDWWRMRNPSRAWARRYTSAGKDLFDDAQELLRKSEVRRRWVRLAKWAGSAIAIAATAAIIFYVVSLNIEQNLNKQLIEKDKLNNSLIAFQSQQNKRLQAQKNEIEKQILQLKQKDAEISDLEKKAKAAELILRSLNATGQWRTTEALVLAQSAMDSDPRAEGAAYAALERHHAAALFEAFAMDASPKGALAVATGANTLKIVDPGTAKTIKEMKLHGVAIGNVAIHPGGTMVAIDDTGASRVQLWDTKTGEAIHAYPTKASARHLWFSADGHWLGIADGTDVTIVDATTLAVVANWPQAMPEASYLTFSSDGRYVATVPRDGDVVVMRLEPSYQPVHHEVPGSSVGVAAFEPNSHTLAVATRAGEVLLLDAETGASKLVGTARPTRALPSRLTAVAFGPDGKLAVGHADGTVDLRGGPQWQIAAETKMNGSVNWLAFSPEGGLLAIADSNGITRLVETANAGTKAVLTAADTSSTQWVGFVDGGRHLVTFGDGVRLWNIESPIVVKRQDSGKVESTPVESTPVAVRPRLCLKAEGGATLGGAQRSETAIVSVQMADTVPMVLAISSIGVDVRRPRIPPLPVAPSRMDIPATFGATARILTAAFDPTRQRVILVYSDGRVAQVGLGPLSDEPVKQLGRLANTPSESDGVLVDVAADGGVLVASGTGRWDLFDPSSQGVLGNDLPVPNGCTVAVDAERRRVLRFATGKLWLADLANPKGVPRELPLFSSSDLPRIGSFSHDGRFVAVVHDNGVVGVWNLERRALIARFGDAAEQLLLPGFSLEGGEVTVAAADGSVYEWPVYSPAELRLAIERSLPAGLSADDKKRILELRYKQ